MERILRVLTFDEHAKGNADLDYWLTKRSAGSSMELASDFSEFCASLNANHVDYLIVGAYAMALHGVPRYTGDLDIFIRPTPDNGARI